MFAELSKSYIHMSHEHNTYNIYGITESLKAMIHEQFTKFWIVPG